MREPGRVSGLLPPAIGFLICGFIWLNLRSAAKIGGGAWLALGLLYSAIRTRGFRRELCRFEEPGD